MKRKYNILIIVLVFLVVIGSISTLFYINLKDDKIVEVEAVVKMVGNDYVIVEDDMGDEYSFETSDEYCIGDRVFFRVENLKDGKKYTEGVVVESSTVSKNINFSIKDCDTEVLDQDNISVDTSMNDNIDIGKDLKVFTDEDVVGYFKTLDNSLENFGQGKITGEGLKKGFVTVVDFLVYGGEIKGKTFNELGNSAKLKVLQIAFSIDEKIEKYYPGYKETISSKGKNAYVGVRDKFSELYLDVATEVCEKDSDLCQNAKEGLKDLKDSFSLTWDYIKKIGNLGIDKLEEWYKIWKET